MKQNRKQNNRQRRVITYTAQTKRRREDKHASCNHLLKNEWQATKLEAQNEQETKKKEKGITRHATASQNGCEQPSKANKRVLL